MGLSPHASQAEIRAFIVGQEHKDKLRLAAASSNGNGHVAPKSKGGRKPGMEEATIQEAQELERIMAEFERTKGTKRGALKSAARKVYGPHVEELKAIRRASKTLSKFRKNVRTKSLH